MTIDVDQNRSVRKWSKTELLGRVLWGLVKPLFKFSPRLFWGWRNFMLRTFGAKIGKRVHIFPTVLITIPWNLDIGERSAVGDRAILYALGPITVGNRATISQGAHICAGTHDIRRNDRPLVKAPITIGHDVWVAADAFVGPNVHIGDNSIVGARAVVMRNIDANSTASGNPAQTKPIRKDKKS